jgi:hypothetical protein
LILDLGGELGCGEGIDTELAKRLIGGDIIFVDVQ